MPRLTHPAVIPVKTGIQKTKNNQHNWLLFTQALHRVRQWAINLALAFIASLAVVLPGPARAQIGGQILDNLLQTGGASGLGRTGDRPLPQVVGSVISVALTLLGMIFLVLIVYGGFIWLLARGREEEVQRAQKILETSVIGLIVIILAFAISKFIFATIITGAGV